MKTVKFSYFWTCIDFSDNISKPEVRQYGIRFKTEEEFLEFKCVWDDAKISNKE